jgi:hypothetical protein
MMEDNRVRPPVRRSHFAVVFAEFAFNLMQAITGFFEALYELSIYHANRTIEERNAWEQMTQDLETIQEEPDGR